MSLLPGHVFEANSAGELASVLEGIAPKTGSQVAENGRAGRKRAEEEFSLVRDVDRIQAHFAESVVLSRADQ